MSSPSPAVSVPTQSSVSTHNYALLIGGYFSLAFAVFQLSAIWWSPAGIRYFGGPAQMSVQTPYVYAALCIIFGLAVAVFGIYSLSGAGTIRRLPLLRTVLIAVTVIYLLRGLLAIPQAPVIVKHPEFARFLVFSLIALAIGLVYLCGVVKLCKQGRPEGSAV